MAITNQFLQAGLDLTNAPAVTGAMLNQMVNDASPGPNMGMVIYSADTGGAPVVPDANTYANFQQCIWARFNGTQIIGYFWNPVGANDPTLLLWQPYNIVTVAPNSINGQTDIIANTITYDRIVSLQWSQLVGSPSVAQQNLFVIPGQAIGAWSTANNITWNSTYSSLTGTYPDNLLIGAGAVGPTMLANTNVDASDATRAVSTNSIQKNAVTIVTTGGNIAKLATPGGAGGIYGAIIGASDGNSWQILSNYLTTAIATLGIGAATQVPQVNAGATALQWWTPPWLKLVTVTDVGGAMPANDTVVTMAHTLGAQPSYVRVVAKCLTAQAGYSIGDEVCLSSFLGWNGTSLAFPFSIATDATNCKILVNSTAVATDFYVVNKAGAGYTNITRADWVLKGYFAL